LYDELIETSIYEFSFADSSQTDTALDAGGKYSNVGTTAIVEKVLLEKWSVFLTEYLVYPMEWLSKLFEKHLENLGNGWGTVS